MRNSADDEAVPVKGYRLDEAGEKGERTKRFMFSVQVLPREMETAVTRRVCRD